MFSNPERALSEIRAVHASAQRAEGNVDLHAIFVELAHRAGMEKRFSQSTSEWSVDNALRKLSFANDATDKAEWALDVGWG